MRTFHVRAAKWLPFVFAATLLFGALAEAQTLGIPAPVSGDCVASSAGAVTCSTTNGTAFAPSATTDTTNAANIASGTLGSARLPLIPVANSQPLVMDTAGLLGLYRFDETSGNLIDYSGNGNAGVVSIEPFRIGGNYEFYDASQVVDFPAALNATNSYYFVVTLPTTAGGSNRYGNNNNAILFTNKTAGGLTFGLQSATSGPLSPTSSLPGTYSLAYGPSNSYARTVFTGELFSGTHVITLVCNSSGTGSFYLDGIGLPVQSGSSGCFNAQSAGNIRLGQPGAALGLWPQGVKYWAAAFYATQDNSEVVLKRAFALKSYAAGRGAPFSDSPASAQEVVTLGGSYSAMTTKLLGQGDSIMCGYGIVDGRCTTAGGGTSPNAYMALLPPLLNNAYATANFGVPSAWMQDSLAAAPVLVDAQAFAGLGQNTAVLATATNNFNTATTYPFVWGLQTAWANGRARAGFRPVLVGVTSRGGSACNGGQNCDAVVQAMNALQRASWKSSKFAGYVDLGSDPLLGATGASMNPGASSCNAGGTITTACVFFWDNLHLYNAGHTRVAQALACVLNGLDGTNAGNMGGATLTGSTTLTCADGGRFADPTSGAVTLTLWSAIWQTGREISFCNVSSSTANALTLSAPTDLPFSNVSGRSTVTVAPNSCARFRATFNGNPAAPGNYWMQM